MIMANRQLQKQGKLRECWDKLALAIYIFSAASCLLGQIKKCVSGIRSENLGRVGTLFFKLFFFLGKKIILCIFKGI